MNPYDAMLQTCARFRRPAQKPLLLTSIAVPSEEINHSPVGESLFGDRPLLGLTGREPSLSPLDAETRASAEIDPAEAKIIDALRPRSAFGPHGNHARWRTNQLFVSGATV